MRANGGAPLAIARLFCPLYTKQPPPLPPVPRGLERAGWLLRSGRDGVTAAQAGRGGFLLPAPRPLACPAPRRLLAQASSHLPLRAQLGVAQPAALRPRLEARNPVLLEGHWGPEGAAGPRCAFLPEHLCRPRSPAAVSASPIALTSSGLASRLFLSASVSQHTALRPERTPCAVDARTQGQGPTFSQWTEKAPCLNLAHFSIGKGERMQAVPPEVIPSPQSHHDCTGSPSLPLPGQGIILG